VLHQAATLLQLLAAADPSLLLHCDSLPLLVHAAAKQAFEAHEAGSAAAPASAGADAGASSSGGIDGASSSSSSSASNKPASRSGPSVQRVVSELLSGVRQAAGSCGQQGSTCLAMWPLWEEQPPAQLAAMGAMVSGQGAPIPPSALAWPVTAAAAGEGAGGTPAWDRLTAAASAASAAAAAGIGSAGLARPSYGQPGYNILEPPPHLIEQYGPYAYEMAEDYNRRAMLGERAPGPCILNGVEMGAR